MVRRNKIGKGRVVEKEGRKGRKKLARQGEMMKEKGERKKD